MQLAQEGDGRGRAQALGPAGEGGDVDEHHRRFLGALVEARVLLLGQELGQQRRLVARKVVALMLQLAGNLSLLHDARGEGEETHDEQRQNIGRGVEPEIGGRECELQRRQR